MVIGQRRHSKMAVAIAFGFFFVATVCVPEETKQFINQLNHGSLSIRMNAANNLEKLGLLAIPEIEAALPKAHGEAAFRLPRLLHALVLRETEYFLKPSVISVPEGEIPLHKLIELIIQQTNNHIVISDEINQTQLMHLSQTTLSFWKVIEEIANQTGCDLCLIQKKPGLALEPQTTKKEWLLSTTSDELIRIVVRRTDPIGSNGAKSTRVILNLAWEPRLRPIAIDMPLSSVLAEGLDGQNIPLINRRGLIEPTPVTGRCWVDLPIQLEHPYTSLNDIDSLRGTINLWIPNFEHNFVFAMKPSFRKKGLRLSQTSELSKVTLADMTGSLDRWEKTDLRDDLFSTFTAYMSAHFETPSVAFESHRNWLRQNTPILLLPDDVCLTPTDHHVISRTDRSVSFRTSFRVPKSFTPENSQINWKLPVGIAQHSISFWLQKK